MSTAPSKRGGLKLRRCAKHATMYKAQFFRTARNKANRIARMKRRAARAALKRERKVGWL